MPQTCSAYGCTNRSNDPNKKLHFHSFPLNDKDRLSKWVHAVKRKGFTPTKHSKLCSEHFKESDYYLGLKHVQLREDVIPSVFPDIPERLLKKPICARTTKTSCNGVVDTASGSTALIDEVDDSMEIVSSLSYDIGVQTEAIASYEDLQNSIKTLRDLVNRQQKQIVQYRNIIKSLRTEIKNVKNPWNEFKGPLRHIIENEVKNRNKKDKRGIRYSEEMKEIALSLHYSSTTNYKNLRKIFTLPHPSSIALWTSTVNAEPGFLDEVLAVLHQFKDEDKDVNLVIDAMSIKKGINFDAELKQYVGFINYGNRDVTDGQATEALFFLLVSLNGRWKLPIAYFLINKITAARQGELINHSLRLTSEKGIRIRSITFDGAATNLATAKYLLRTSSSNAETEWDEFDLIEDEIDDIDELDQLFDDSGIEAESALDEYPNYFLHPATIKKIYVILDPCHMVKLVRNALAAYKTFRTADGTIEWRYLSDLYHLQEKLGLKFANKLSKTHIEFYNNKMKVKYAVQALSSSVADAIDWLGSAGIENFQNSSATSTFIRTIDKIFDFLNSRNPYGKGFKKPIFLNNIDYFEKKVTEWSNYLISLRTEHGIPILMTRRKCFVIGLVMALKSVLQVSKELLTSSPSYFKYVLTYKFSQDHIEMLFGKFRLRLGCNNNPTALQLKYIVKKVLLKNCISITAACNQGVYRFLKS